MMPKVSTAPYSHVQFRTLAIGEFPELQVQFKACDGLLHLEMHAFARLMRDAIERADWDRYRRGVRLATELWSRPDAKLLNALNVSFLEHIEFIGPHGAEAWKRLTLVLQKAWQAMKAYNELAADVARPPRKNKDKPR